MAKTSKVRKDLVVGIPDTANLKEARVNADQIGKMVKEIAGGRGKAVQQVPAVRVKGDRAAARAAGVDAGIIGDPASWTKTIWRRSCSSFDPIDTPIDDDFGGKQPLGLKTPKAGSRKRK